MLATPRVLQVRHNVWETPDYMADAATFGLAARV